MSEDNADQTGEAPQEPQLDASFKVNADALSSEEADFARQMGFGDGGNEEGAEAKPAKAASAEPSPEPPTPTQANDVKASEDEADDSPTEVEEEAVAVTADESVGQVTEEAIDSDASATQMDWEEINPRSASEGIQSTLESRADELLGLESTSPGTSDGRAASNQTIAAVEQQCVTLQAQLDHRETELTQLRASLDAEIDSQAREGKELEELRVELDTLSLDRDQLIDQLALISGQLVQSKARNEKLDASLRAARGALTPLPEGERALRAEVIGLRGRLNEAREENHGISTQLSVSATDLAIARARVEDRQHEVHSQLELVEEAEARLAENEIQLKSTLGRHREMVAMTTRLQADNNELRSAQAALEETLEARDLEIVAREEHLTVTRQGLVARDLQLVDVNEILDQEQRRSEALTADLQRNRIHHDQLVHKVSHRESRIATLTETLARIEEAMGHPIPGPDSVAREMPEAEWTRPTLVPKAPSLEKMPPAPRTPTPVVAPSQATAPAEIVESEPMPETVIIEEPTERDAALPPLEPLEKAEEQAPAPRVLSATPSLPPILSTWRDRRFAEVKGESGPVSPHAFFAEQLLKHLGSPGPEYLYVRSLGGGLADSEVRLATSLRDLGIQGLRIDVLDCDEAQADARRRKIELAGLGEVIEVTVGDLDRWDAQAPCHAILLSDALHAQPNAGAFLDHIAPTLANGAIVFFLDRIASGPLQLSASALNRLEELWALLPETLMKVAGLSTVPHRGDDGGFPAAACDPAHEILIRLDPIVISGFGHLGDLVVGPTRGMAMSVESFEAMQLLESIMAMDESRSLTENLIPRHGLGVFAQNYSGPPEIIGQDWPGVPKLVS